MHSLEEIFASFGQNSGYARELYQNYLTDPGSVPADWAEFFSGLEVELPESVVPYSGNGHSIQLVASADLGLAQRVALLVESYRSEGHLHAQINPLSKGTNNPTASASFVEFSGSELEQDLPWSGFGVGRRGKVRDLVLALQSVYCGSVGYEFTHLLNAQEKEWLRSRIETGRGTNYFELSRKKRLLKMLVEAEGLESELHKTYVGAKRFSIQGGETLLPVLDCVIERGAAAGLKHVVIGMAHRGRLNVLTHIAGKPYEILFAEFEDESLAAVVGAGDVKYHLGYSSAYRTASGSSVQVELTPNPSHLEFVNPVVEGVVRARQDLEFGSQRASVMPILIHGDAAFIGQGISWETLNFAGVDGFDTGGTVHIVVNNQVGFTASPRESRTSIYCTDMAKAIQAPV
ncbi:MAG: 2-oxoglutarate dehydrogenase E1 component, partial [Oligoflexia bacterium]|nr:2-oxoglutarate dehydrogenase E1 component [Oligoflexia bacterium]